MSDGTDIRPENLAEEAAKVIEKTLQRFDRGGFRKELARLLGCAPSTKALMAFAEKSPDKWAQAVTMLAGLTGFERGVNVNVNVRDVTALTDIELIEEYIRTAGTLPEWLKGRTGGAGQIPQTPGSELPKLPEKVVNGTNE